MPRGACDTLISRGCGIIHSEHDARMNKVLDRYIGMENLKIILTRIFAVFTAVGFLLFLGALLVKPKPSGNMLTDYYVEDASTAFVCSRLFDAGLLMFLFFGAALFVLLVVTHLTGEDDGMSFRTLICCSWLAIMGLVFACVAFSQLVPMIGNEPRVEVVTVVDKNCRYGGGKIKHMRYSLSFSNGTRRSVSHDDYYDAEAGDPYYLIMCGSQPISAYNPADYTLPSTSQPS